MPTNATARKVDTAELYFKDSVKFHNTKKKSLIHESMPLNLFNFETKQKHVITQYTIEYLQF